MRRRTFGQVVADDVLGKNWDKPKRKRKRKRETAQERDERIVAEVGPWINDMGVVVSEAETSMSENREACDALARIANRIAKKRREK